MKFDCIVINGDSYSAPNPSVTVYGEYLAEMLDLPLVNLAMQGSNNNRILRSSIEFLENTKFKNPLVIVGWSFIRRIEVWYYGNNKTIMDLLPDQNNDEGKNLRFITLNWLINHDEATIEEKALIKEDLFVHKQLTSFYTDLFLFSNYLQKNNVEYFFFSAAKNNEVPLHCFPAIENLSLVKSVVNDPKIFKLHDFFIQDWASANDPQAHPLTGHLSSDGHNKFANYLLTLIPS